MKLLDKPGGRKFTVVLAAAVLAFAVVLYVLSFHAGNREALDLARHVLSGWMIICTAYLGANVAEKVIPQKREEKK
ncbi:MAG: hypothetical protein P9M15_01705 [Candidatus Electryoneaceae bacterium]|nr:hypothetical protein [Candidatus Electryoneaceae bacterium]